MKNHRFVLFGAFLVMAGCSSEEGQKTAARDPLAPYPPTGVTREFELTIDETQWEVGPGAIYNAIAYNGVIPGPPIEVDAGDHVVLRVTNNAAKPHSVHTHVVKFTYTNDGTHNSVVAPGETKTIEWDAVYAGTFPYHDHGDEAEGTKRGIFGALIVHPPGEAKANEHVVVLADFDQGEYDSLPGVADPETGEFPDAGVYHGGHQYMHTINGKGYEDAIPAFKGKVGELQRFRVVSIGNEFHTWHIHGHRWLDGSGQLTDNVQLGPGMYTTFEFMEDNPGTWLVHCHVGEHMEGGMIADYVVTP
ncbi:multicopper oxidase domain-containing protein [Polyangium jinanense]|uniref:Multicopper oxidase domain-containing protein n=1 Tax=Polyangium jinanense TaxID=2829994 RepID=A0A9X3XBU6_9BACT|nr:multicopper oxidase domain-containing protein [Polyangium jinanense]MDC3957488.1 multicopper oxidase domain-containing protein [Polyangium jinanense]MDC3985021.1 multicopper oxidase domain-containing protein [Polyangium jinanense]